LPHLVSLIRFQIFLLFFSIVFFSGPLFAETNSAYEAHTQVELIADTDRVQSGAEFHAGVLFRMDPEWHVYWKNPGDSGMAPVFKWVLPEGISVGAVQWPTPKKIDLPPLSSYGYEGEVLLAMPFQVSSAFNPNDLGLIKVKVEWLACKVECIPGQAELELAAPFPAQADIFEKTKARYPIQDNAFEIHAKRFDKTIALTFFPQVGPVLEQAYFFPENAELVAHAETQSFTVLPQGYRLNVPLAVTQPKVLERLRGVLVSGERAWEMDIPFETNAAPIETSLRFSGAVLFAFLGGLILNLMPCVLPVLLLP
jgi:DsbC/DsbD-like thiol-disulfide interchange protein